MYILLKCSLFRNENKIISHYKSNGFGERNSKKTEKKEEEVLSNLNEQNHKNEVN